MKWSKTELKLKRAQGLYPYEGSHHEIVNQIYIARDDEILDDDDYLLDDYDKNSLPDLTGQIPAECPVVPIIAQTSHPIFPKFIRIIEIEDPKLKKLILTNVKNKFPYAGIFVRKDDTAESNAFVAEHTSELYNVGTFIHIQGSRANILRTR